MHADVSAFLATFAGKETEENWEIREQALRRLRTLCGDAGTRRAVAANTKEVVESLARTVLSLRSALVTSACATIETLIKCLGRDFDSAHADRMLPNLLRLMTQGKRLILNTGTACVLTLIQHSPFSNRILEKLLEGAADKNVALREKCIHFVTAIVKCAIVDDSYLSLMVRANGLESIVRGIVRGLGDASSAVREQSRALYALFQQHWPSRAESYILLHRRLLTKES
jgi:CLIP-associating protein 1/2